MSARAKKPTGKPPPTPPRRGSDDPEEQKTTIFDSGRHPKQEPHQSGQLQMISMKTPMEQSGEHKPAHRVHQVKMRAISEVTPLSHAQPKNMGNLAPPRDASEARTRHMRDYVIWGCLSVILASVIALAVWFLGR